MTTKHSKPSASTPSRRQFLQAAAAVASGAALAAPTAAAAAPSAAAAAKPAARGYQKTAHVSRYYQLARDL